MPIYSNNRTGSMALAQVAANESYTSEDFGRILYESQLNDMAFFEAILACDFKEINGLREGTILESEVASLNEASLKELANKAIEGLKLFWGKIKAAFEDAIDKIALYIMKDGKSIAKNLREVDLKNWDGHIGNVKTFDFRNSAVDLADIGFKKLVTAAYSDKNVNVAGIVGEYLKEKLGASEAVTPREYAKKAFEKCVKADIVVNAGNVNEIVNSLDGAKLQITYLKSQQKAAESSINAAIADLKKGAEETKDAARLNAVVRAYETVVATIAKTGIQVTRADIKSKSKALVAVIHAAKKTVNEAADMEIACAMDSFDEAMTGTLNMDAETKAAVAELVAAC